jgi:hypothetical protein
MFTGAMRPVGIFGQTPWKLLERKIELFGNGLVDPSETGKALRMVVLLGGLEELGRAYGYDLSKHLGMPWFSLPEHVRNQSRSEGEKISPGTPPHPGFPLGQNYYGDLTAPNPPWLQWFMEPKSILKTWGGVQRQVRLGQHLKGGRELPTGFEESPKAYIMGIPSSKQKNLLRDQKERKEYWDLRKRRGRAPEGSPLEYLEEWFD